MKKTTLRPLGNRIVLKRQEMQETKGGILLPESAKDKSLEAEVLAVGPGKVNAKGKLEPMGVSVGDRVLFSSYAGTEYKVDKEELLIVSEEDVLAVL